MPNNAFLGNVSHTIDPKGRVTIPNEFRECLGDDFTISVNASYRTIVLYPLESWKEKMEQLSRIPREDDIGSRYALMVYCNSFPNNHLDAQGRVLLPLSLRKRYLPNKEICFVGAGETLEIWDEKIFNKENEDAELNAKELQRYVFENYFRRGD